MDRDDEDRALLDAIELVTARLVAEPHVNYEMLTELGELREEIERELRARPVPSGRNLGGGDAGVA